MGGNKVAPPKAKNAAAGGTGKTYQGKKGENAGNGLAGGSSGYGPAGGVKKSSGMGGGGASSAEVK